MSMHLQFDTLRYAESLKSAGVPGAQAKAKTEALSTVLKEAAASTLATKDDIRSCRAEMAKAKFEMRSMKWLMTIGALGLTLLIAMHLR